MPSFTTDARPLADVDADLLVVGAHAADGPSAPGDRGDDDQPPTLTAGAQELAERLDIDLAAELKAAGFDGAPGTSLRVPTRGALQAATVLVVGLGARDQAGTDELRRAGAAAAIATERHARLATDLHTATDGVEVAAAAQAVAEGIGLGSYRYGLFQSDARPHRLEEAVLAGGDADAAQRGLDVAAVTIASEALTRDLVNTPPQAKRPPALAERAREEVADLPVEVEILDEAALADGGYGGLLGVGQGSSAPPRLVQLTYAPDGATRHVALVGKGITFDTGGISLKPSQAMETMKMDMAGAATVLATVKAAAALDLPVKVTGLMALAENMPSGTATRVSDVLTIRGGTTVEVVNTDAEGRLVLADALVHASEQQPDVIVDLATLTGAAAVALGPRIGVLMADDDDLAEALLAASRAAGEAFWRLPLASEHYADELKGDIADLKNAGWKGAGTIRAGLFLHEFVGDGIPWAHLDIAAVAWTDEPRDHLTKGATGVPARTLLEWLRSG